MVNEKRKSGQKGIGKVPMSGTGKGKKAPREKRQAKSPMAKKMKQPFFQVDVIWGKTSSGNYILFLKAKRMERHIT